jgi:hypothetical protein
MVTKIREEDFASYKSKNTEKSLARMEKEGNIFGIADVVKLNFSIGQILSHHIAKVTMKYVLGGEIYKEATVADMRSEIHLRIIPDLVELCQTKEEALYAGIKSEEYMDGILEMFKSGKMLSGFSDFLTKKYGLQTDSIISDEKN